MNSNHTPITDGILVKYVLDITNDAERRIVESWLHLDSRNKKYIEDLKRIIEKSELPVAIEVNEFEALNRLHIRMERDQFKTRQGYQPFRLSWINIAASLIVISAFSVYFLSSNDLTEPRKIKVQTVQSTLRDTLPDGSVATLNKHSSLSFPAKFNADVREVVLTGEAFFEVSANKNKPFIIRVNDLKIKVVGTSFNVRSRGAETTVIVESGIVSVAKQSRNVLLKAGEKVNVLAHSVGLTKQTNSGNLYNYYYTNKLVCNNTPLPELIQTLNEKFNSNIVITKRSMTGLRISTVFTDQSLDEILEVIAETFKLHVAYNDGKILLK